MGNSIHPQELVKIAIDVEEAGRKLYSQLEQQAKQQEVKEIWRYLKEQEVIHKNLFQQMLDNIDDYVVYEVTEGQYDAYLQAIADNYIFTYQRIQQSLDCQFFSDKEAINFGIDVEKDSILAYTAFKEYVTADRQDVIDKILHEEKDHLVRLTQMKQQVLS